MPWKETQPDRATDRSDSTHHFRGKPMMSKLVVGAGLAMVALFLATALMSGQSESPERTDSMFLTKSEAAVNRAMPPLDAAGPANVQTATFALG